ncbi:hypothetical protein RBSH_01521 [Rhodopirellula baltica SH28]|uniref:Uncharacterized protein n=2 Tax=Rhodopirellula baltica TaxID=265606 RepID=K5EBJ4_RHOBT|nr:hypothetical protein RBSH_01521 [Rhodopirellula baltica SH28]ELP34796.1 hypothetical protein RBSWK_01303 [Rhodopirellula baltica SWK14]
MDEVVIKNARQRRQKRTSSAGIPYQPAQHQPTGTLDKDETLG